MKLSVDNAKYLAKSLMSMSEGLFIIHSQNDKPSLPMVAFSLNPEKNLKFNETTLVHWLKERGWIVPAYTLAANANDITVCRIVVRETFTRNFASILLEDIRLVLISLADHHGHQDLVESLKAAHDDKHQHRRSNRHGELVAKNIQSNQKASGNRGNTEKVEKGRHYTVHIIC
jgi:glutamate decarboxylase